MTFAPIGPNHLTDASKEDRITFFQLLQLANLENSFGFRVDQKLTSLGRNTRMEIGFFMIDFSRLVQVLAKCFPKNRLGTGFFQFFT
jgi:hypothetical protein